MDEYLLDREKDELFRVSTRQLTFPDGAIWSIEAYRLVWIWFDRAVAYRYGPSANEILDLTLKCAREESLSLGDALGSVLTYIVETDEANGMEYTDDNLGCLVSYRALARFLERKA